MTIFERLRLFHAAQAILAIAVYLTGELGLIHAWLGYGLAALILFRILWGLAGPRQVSLSKFVPVLTEVRKAASPDHPVIGKVLLAGVAVSLLLATLTGFALDTPAFTSAGMRTGSASVNAAAPAAAPAVIRMGFEYGEDDEDGGESWIGEAHEATAGLFLFFAALHAAYLLLFKRNFALFMLFRKSAGTAS